MTSPTKVARDFTTEFPDFDAATMPAIPSGFVDRSWRNETCPCFRNEVLSLTLHVDYANPADRECAETTSFRLVLEGEQITTDADRAYLVESDNWEEVLCAVEAVTLARVLGVQSVADIGADKVAEAASQLSSRTTDADPLRAFGADISRIETLSKTNLSVLSL